MPGLLIDLSPLRRLPGFRRLWIGATLSQLGSTLSLFALPLQVFDLTRSSLAVGLVSAAQLVPLVVVGLLGGAVADSGARRRTLILAGGGLLLTSLALAASAHIGRPQVWRLFPLAALAAGLSGISGPLRRTLIVSELDPVDLVPGLALQRLSAQVTFTAGPALAGVLVALPGVGLRGCYLIDAASFLATGYGLRGARGAQAPAGAEPGAGRRAALREGMRFVRTSRALVGAFLADLAITVLGLPVALFPAINAARFDADPRTLGLLSAAIGAGGLVAGVLSGSLARIRRPGAAMLIAVALSGAAIAVFGLVPDLASCLIALAVAGAADSVTVVMRGTIVQSLTPDALRGRITAVDWVIGVSGGRLGAVEAGGLAALTSPVFSAVSGGLATVLAAGAVAMAVPGLAAYRRSHPAAAPGDAT